MESKNKLLTILVVVAIVIATSIVWILLRRGPQGTISEEGAIAKIKTYIAEMDKIPKENIQIDNIELRSPTESEENYLREVWQGKEPPELIWFADVTRFSGNVGPRGGTIWLDAHTGEIVSGTFDD